MNYSFQVAYINTLRQKKIIPEGLLIDLASNKNFSSFVALLKEYGYLLNLDLSSEKLLDGYNFESVIKKHLDETLYFIDSLFYPDHRWITDCLKNYFLENKFNSQEDLNSFFKSIYFSFKKLNSNLLNNLVNLIVEFENIKLFMSYTLVENISSKELRFINLGRISEILLKELFPSIEALNIYLSNTYYPYIKLTTQPATENFNYYFIYYLKELIWQSRFYYFTIEPLVFYFLEKFVETQKLKEIYYDIKLNIRLNENKSI
ncbi:MAG: hypothetical protein ABDH23_02760 [Endomicrobiia bacterium]